MPRGSGRFRGVRSILFIGLLGMPGLAPAQFLVPAGRGGANTEHAKWDVFTNARLGPNVPDVARDLPTDDARLTCTTSNAFLTSGGNIYSFSGATAFQIVDSTNYAVRSIFLQVKTVGTALNLGSVRLVGEDLSGEVFEAFPVRTFELAREDFENEFGGGDILGRAFQWDLSGRPVGPGGYTILFAAASSSMSLDVVSLDTASTYAEVPEPGSEPPEPPFLRIEREGAFLLLTWPESAGGVVETNDDLGDPSGWVPVSGVATAQAGVLRLQVAPTGGRGFFRLNY